MNVYLPNLRLPSTYQEVEYIQSSGTQYIVIGTSFKTSYKTVIDFQMTVTGGDYIPVGIKYNTTRYGIDAYNSKFMVNGGGQTWINTISEDTNRHTITIDKGTAIVDGNNYSVSYTNYTFSQGIGVFCYNEYDSSKHTYKSSNKLYKLDIYDENGIHIYDLVPCYRKSDSVIGLYDLVNNQFYTNAGSGTFSKGNDVTMTELKNAYIGKVYEYSYDFRGKTAAQIQNDFTLLTGTIQTNSNGVTGNSSYDCRLGHDIPILTNAKRIIISNTIICQAGSNTSGSTGVGKGSGWGNGYADFHTHGSDFGGIRVTMYDGVDHYGNTVGNVTNATYNPTMTIDLENKTLTGVLSGFSNSTLSLTDSQVAEIRSYTYLLVYVSKARATISDVSIEIEY